MQERNERSLTARRKALETERCFKFNQFLAVEVAEGEASLEERARDLDEQTEGRKRERKDQKGLAGLSESRGFGLFLHFSPPFVVQVIYRTFVQKVEGILEKPSSF